MSATTIPALSAPSAILGHGLRLALVATAIVVLLAMSFVAGRSTGTTTSVTPVATPTSTRAPAAGASMTPQTCHMVPDC